MEISKIAIGSMRFKNRESAIKTIHAAIDAGFNYIDTAPCYCAQDSEAWVGEAVRHPDYRSRVLVSTKCAPGNGGYGLGNLDAANGFGVRTVDQFDTVFDQSMKRLGMERVDYYHLWTTHTREQFADGMKPGGWYDGLMGQKDNWDRLGVTTHADPKTIIEFLETGKFETVTVPLNIINRTRLDILDYCSGKGIKVIAMNPLAGGFITANEELKELAIRFLMLLPNVHALIGFSSVEEVEYARWILDTMPGFKMDVQAVLARVDELMDAEEPRCTGCGYCQPCPEDINVGEALSYYNSYKYMGIKEARKMFNARQWFDGLCLKNCTQCGDCESRCPNGLSVREIIMDAQRVLYQ